VQILGPERLRDQGLDPEQEESGNRAILALLSDPEVADQMDLVATYRRGEGQGEGGEAGAYEVWAARGMVRFRRLLRDDGSLDYRVIEQIGTNPIGCQDPHALRTVAEEKEAARASGFDPEDPARRFIAPEQQSYPFASTPPMHRIWSSHRETGARGFSGEPTVASTCASRGVPSGSPVPAFAPAATSSLRGRWTSHRPVWPPSAFP
jgi:hypothetical protein